MAETSLVSAAHVEIPSLVGSLFGPKVDIFPAQMYKSKYPRWWAAYSDSAFNEAQFLTLGRNTLAGGQPIRTDSWNYAFRARFGAYFGRFRGTTPSIRAAGPTFFPLPNHLRGPMQGVGPKPVLCAHPLHGGHFVTVARGPGQHNFSIARSQETVNREPVTGCGSRFCALPSPDLRGLLLPQCCGKSKVLPEIGSAMMQQTSEVLQVQGVRTTKTTTWHEKHERRVLPRRSLSCVSWPFAHFVVQTPGLGAAMCMADDVPAQNFVPHPINIKDLRIHQDCDKMSMLLHKEERPLLPLLAVAIVWLVPWLLKPVFHYPFAPSCQTADFFLTLASLQDAVSRIHMAWFP